MENKVVKIKEKEELSLKVLNDNLKNIEYSLDREYISQLDKEYYVLPYNEYNKNNEQFQSYSSNVRALKIKRLVYDKEQDFTDCLQNVLSTFSNSGKTVALIFNRGIDFVDVYAVIKNRGQGKNEESKSDIELFGKSLLGNFAGSEYEEIIEKNGGKDTEKIFWMDDKNLIDNYSSISAVCNIPAAKSEKYLSQNLEKVFNGIVPKDNKEIYSMIILAESFTLEDVQMIREGFQDIASNIYPFQQSQFQMGENESKTKGETTSQSQTNNISEALAKTHSVNISQSVTIGGGMELVNASATTNVGYSYSQGKTTTEGSSDTKTKGRNNSETNGKSENITYSFQSYAIKNIIERLEQSLDRIKKGEALGLWKYATYICASSPKVSKSVANYFRALTQGEASFLEPSYIKEWHEESNCEQSDFEEIKKYLLTFSHPVFRSDKYSMSVNFSTNLNTLELSRVMAFPQNSVQGVPVTSGVTFGREPNSLTPIDRDLKIGNGYHMFDTISASDITLSKNELTKHAFITGSTGSGKSNTIYTILYKLMQEGVKFLVVEPAKGEYKDTIGKIQGVTTYGTNPKLFGKNMLRLNPFRFPENIHVLEHLDRLIEIFNVCWPMYAAMPAILKDAVEQAYIKSGWDLEKSVNKYSSELFPTFKDVAREIKQVLQSSEYSADSKGDYTGALVTRIQSLTNGLNGLIFSSDDIDDAQLFDENVIVDLSRIGSVETKSLIMGILVLKLQEYRMNQRLIGSNLNDELRHITVLEEAHNILKRTSTSSSNESSNILGKSVEMLSNSIAEMRTYGEGFIIADQSPGLLDMSVIRNTNTKIILRLPDFSDRELVGKSIGLSEDQILEVARLERGVAVVSQSDWIEPVLCKVDFYKNENSSEFNTLTTTDSSSENSFINIHKILLDSIMTKEIYRKIDKLDTINWKEAILKSKLDTLVKCDLFDYMMCDHMHRVKISRKLMYNFLGAEKAIERSGKNIEIETLAKSVIDNLSEDLSIYNTRQINNLIGSLLYEHSVRDFEYKDKLFKFTEFLVKERGV